MAAADERQLIPLQAGVGTLPVVHIAVGGRQADDRYRLGRARGIIALGDIATGLVAVGGVAIGSSASVRLPSGWSRSAQWPSP